MRALISTTLRRFRSDQGGQSLVIVSLAMVVVLGVSAMAIDAATWYQRHHQDQVVADSAALAAANCLAHPNTGSSPQCTSNTDTTDAITVAQDYASANGLKNLPTSDISINTSNDTVQVTAPSTSPTFFANVFSLHSAKQQADATAGWQVTQSTTCTATDESAGECAAIYSASTSCPADNGLTVGTSSNGGASVTVVGGVHSEGGLAFSNSQMTASSLTVAGSCYTSSSMPSVQEVSSSTTLKASQTSSEPWPINYAASPYFTACTTTCIDLGGIKVPPYCTYATTSSSGWTFVLVNNKGEVPETGNVYCAIGTGTSTDPTTWNGPITVGENLGMNGSSCSDPPDVTLIGGSVTFTDSQTCLDADLDGCLAYATTGNVQIYDGTYSWDGVIFAPNGTVELGSMSSGGSDTSKNVTGMIEGLNVELLNVTLDMTGTGPTSAGSGSTTSGTDSLEQ